MAVSGRTDDGTRADGAAALIRAAVIEDDAHFLARVSRAVEQAPDMCLVACAQTHAQGCRLIAEQALDILLVDLGLPDGDGVDLIRRARQLQPACELMVISAFTDESHILQAIEAGASGYLMKDDPAEDIVPQLRDLLAGGSPISPLIARKLLQHFQREAAASAVPAAPAASTTSAAAQESVPASGESLSGREQHVLRQFTLGLTNREIAAQMGVSLHTVQTFVRRLYRKLSVRSRPEAVFEAQRRGWLDD